MLFVAMIALFVAIIVGVYVNLRNGLLAPHKLSKKYPRLESLLRYYKTDDWAGVLCGAPIAFSVVAGFGVIAVHCIVWLATATWEKSTVQSTWGWATPRSGLLGLDKFLSWLIADAPLELWLIVIFPLMWAAALSIPTAIATKIWRRGSAP